MKKYAITVKMAHFKICWKIQLYLSLAGVIMGCMNLSAVELFDCLLIIRELICKNEYILFIYKDTWCSLYLCYNRSERRRDRHFM